MSSDAMHSYAWARADQRNHDLVASVRLAVTRALAHLDSCQPGDSNTVQSQHLVHDSASMDTFSRILLIWGEEFYKMLAISFKSGEVERNVLKCMKQN